MQPRRVRTSHGTMRTLAKIHKRFRLCLRLVHVYVAWGGGLGVGPGGPGILGGLMIKDLDTA